MNSGAIPAISSLDTRVSTGFPKSLQFRLRGYHAHVLRADRPGPIVAGGLHVQQERLPELGSRSVS
jgi:hypothetical protein